MQFSVDFAHYQGHLTFSPQLCPWRTWDSRLPRPSPGSGRTVSGRSPCDTWSPRPEKNGKRYSRAYFVCIFLSKSRTLHWHVRQLMSPCGPTLGCHDSPFSLNPFLHGHPPSSRASSLVRGRCCWPSSPGCSASPDGATGRGLQTW